MEYVARLLSDKEYRQKLLRLEQLEAERIYCRHNMTHFMDVARLAQIRNLELKLNQDKEMIYLYALLHDMGRVAEYEQGISHAQASADYAGEILMRIGYRKDKVSVIQNAILHHRGFLEESGEEAIFDGLMHWADKASRMCFTCPAQASCKWSEEQKNQAEQWM